MKITTEDIGKKIIIKGRWCTFGGNNIQKKIIKLSDNGHMVLLRELPDYYDLWPNEIVETWVKSESKDFLDTL